MCNAFTLTQTAELIKTEFGLKDELDFSPRYNIRPTQLTPVITQGNKLAMSLYYWGTTPDFAKDKALSEKLYNIRADSLEDTVLHKKALENRRCLVPADGFYTWKQISKKGQVPYRYFLADNKLFAFAGLWQEFENINGETAYTFSIITTTANDLVGQTNARMPVILDAENRNTWLNGTANEALSCLNTFSDDHMEGYAVSNRVNNPGTDDADLLNPAPPADQFGNYSLFD